MPLIFVLLLAFIIELIVLIKVGALIGAINTVLLVFLTATIGIAIIFRQGFTVLQRAQVLSQEGKVPALELVEALLLLVAAVLLFTPGFISDFMGFMLLVPPLRAHLAKTTIGKAIARKTYFRGPAGGGNRSSQRGQIIEGEYTDLEKKE
ncbi:FxsA family protein [Gynuella sunshinyii]|uniref:Protein affecting phage T7 exclusion by the F plasmid n=1 Tax=Gynuella sunshinyii YC6258 TaxID=1445510 RepID=A0A0C5W1I0_9GAMM|nr:FxsA family protein [Gynuella sunshinyii]AJQ96534.1 protein affecting phage T7 exclusion by the F plasmid [Gynuella sunshinyii YC6258]